MGPSSADVTLLFVIPFLSELKISWAFVAVPLHFQRLGFPLWAFGLTLSVATLCRVPMNTLITLTGDWLLVPLLALATVSAAWMLAAPNTLWAVVAGIVAGHVTDTSQVQASLCYRWQSADPAAQKRGLRLQAFSCTLGYSSGALIGGALYENGGFYGCAVLQLAILVVMTLSAALLPVIHDAFGDLLDGINPEPRASSASAAESAAPELGVPPGVSAPPFDRNQRVVVVGLTERVDLNGCSAKVIKEYQGRVAVWLVDSAECVRVKAENLLTAPPAQQQQPPQQQLPSELSVDHSATLLAEPPVPPLTLWGTTGPLLLPASLLWLCDGFNIGCYICEWALFAVYFSDAFGWSSTLTGAAQMAGDLVAAAVLALTTTQLWARLVRHDGATRRFERLLLRPPWNLGLFFGAYSVRPTSAPDKTLGQHASAHGGARALLSVAFLGDFLDARAAHILGECARPSPDGHRVRVQQTSRDRVVRGPEPRGQSASGLHLILLSALVIRYVVLSHGALPLFRRLEFVGSCAFNICMSASTLLAVLWYERLGRTAPFVIVAVVSSLWAALIVIYFGLRLSGLGGSSWSEAEHTLLTRRMSTPSRTRAL